jgi:hypothetical protein
MSGRNPPTDEGEGKGEGESDAEETIDTSGNSDVETDPGVVSLQSAASIDWFRSNRPSKEMLSNRYQTGDTVSTPDQGVGVVVDAVSENKEAPDDGDFSDIEASPDSPTYVVVTEDDADGGFGLFKAADLDMTEISTEVDALDSTKAVAAMAALAPDPDDIDSDNEYVELDFTVPRTWRQSDTPSRVIALKALAGMGGSFDGCVREMRGEVSDPQEFCASFLDYALGYPYWRGDSPLPGD